MLGRMATDRVQTADADGPASADQIVADPTTSIYIASAEGETGKSIVALGLLALLSATGGRVGVFRPISRTAAEDRDPILDLLLDYESADLPYEDCLGVTYEEVHNDPEGAVAEIVARFHAIQSRCDRVVIVGSDYTDVGTP